MQFLSYLINGISLGSVYALIALGYTMVYGIAKMLNFAHGDVIMVGHISVFSPLSGLSGSFEEGSLAGAVSLLWPACCWHGSVHRPGHGHRTAGL